MLGFKEKRNVESLTSFGGLFLHDGNIAVPDALGLGEHVIHEMQDSPYAGHLAVGKARKLVSRHCWWPTLPSDVEQLLVCDSCQKEEAPFNQAWWPTATPLVTTRPVTHSHHGFHH